MGDRSLSRRNLFRTHDAALRVAEAAHVRATEVRERAEVLDSRIVEVSRRLATTDRWLTAHATLVVRELAVLRARLERIERLTWHQRLRYVLTGRLPVSADVLAAEHAAAAAPSAEARA